MIIDTPDGMLFFNMLQVEKALKIQRDTGLTYSRGSVLKYAKQRYGIQGVRIASAAEQMEALVAGAQAAQSVHNGASYVDCPYRKRLLIGAFMRGAEMMGVKLDTEVDDATDRDTGSH